MTSHRAGVDPAVAIVLLLALLFCLHGIFWGRVECWNRDQMALRDLAGLRPGERVVVKGGVRLND